MLIQNNDKKSVVLSCFWSISINGKSLDLDRRKCVVEVQTDEKLQGSSTCNIKIDDPNFIYINDNIFIEEAKIDITFGWNEDVYRRNFSGYISAIDIDFPEDGTPQLDLYCLDDTHRMNREKKKRSWEKVSNADVVKKIGKEYGFKVVIEPGYNFEKKDTISQSDMTDIEFLEKLAKGERDKFTCTLKGNELRYVKVGIGKKAVSRFHYRKYPYDIISFNPKINKENNKEKVQKADITSKSKKVDKGVGSNSKTKRDLHGKPVKTSSSATNYGSIGNKVVFNPKTRKWSHTSPGSGNGGGIR